MQLQASDKVMVAVQRFRDMNAQVRQLQEKPPKKPDVGRMPL